MLKLILQRKAFKADYTIGKLKYSYKKSNNQWTKEVALCDTLEPAYLASRANVQGSGMAIAPGEYIVLVSYSNKFKQWLPILTNTGNRSGIRIHSGNLPSETEGCILVGTNSEVGRLSDSRAALKKLMRIINKHWKEGEVIKLEIS